MKEFKGVSVTWDFEGFSMGFGFSMRFCGFSVGSLGFSMEFQLDF